MGNLLLMIVLGIFVLAGNVAATTSDGDYMFAGEMQSSRGIDCRACGDECIIKCGTKMFRTCCFHFSNKKKRHELGPAGERQSIAMVLPEHEDTSGHDPYGDSFEIKSYQRH
ncbi:unnamed protein product [Allacma fusca]|uniref:Uncharacterized protein n=1 Tax=Allacma fusca TaxID=39272 RepID=A0A8J2NQG0_9HEXA|nr:unnamed protein product [Allacma fusca]